MERKVSASVEPARSPSRTVSPRQRATVSSTSRRASSWLILPLRASSAASSSTRSFVRATAPTPARSASSARSRSERAESRLPGSSMGPRPASFAARLTARGRAAAVRGRRDRLRRGRRHGRRRLRGPPVGLGGLELLQEAGLLALLVLGLALLEDDEEGRGDEDGREGARADADQEGERELLERVAAEEDEGAHGQQGDEGRRERAADR